LLLAWFRFILVVCFARNTGRVVQIAKGSSKYLHERFQASIFETVNPGMNFQQLASLPGLS
jgi:hypothetical protein